MPHTERYAGLIMPVYVCLLRGVNVGGNNILRMETLRNLCGELGFTRVSTLLQSGNVVFESSIRSGVKVASILEKALLESGIRTDVIIRSAAELKAVLAANPMASRPDFHPSRFVVTFLKSDPGETSRQAVRTLSISPEELWIIGSELYVHYPNGIAISKLPVSLIQRALKVPGTARNWATVQKLYALATA